MGATEGFTLAEDGSGAEIANSVGTDGRLRQQVVWCDDDGNVLGPAATATPLAPITNLGTSWAEVVDLASARGCEIQNDADVDMFYCYGSTLPAASDFGLRLRKGASRFFAPPRDRGFVGKIYAKTESGSNKTLRRLTW